MLGSLLNSHVSTLANAMPPLQFSHEVANGLGLADDRPLEKWIFRDLTPVDGVVAADGLFMLIFWFSLFFFVLLMGLMVYWVIKYRRRPGVPAPVSPSHNTPLEIIWTVVPSSSLLVIFLFGFWTYMERQVPGGNAIELNIQGFKWGWNITYPGGEQSPWVTPLDPGNAYNVPVFIVPEDSEISLRMISTDVIHSFWIPDMRVKMDLFPNRYTGYAFETPALPPGVEYTDHWVFCAEYCGDSHSEMAAVMRVVRKQAYKPTLAAWAAGDDPLERAKRIHAVQCAACHSVDGTANTGPTWLNLYGYERQMQSGEMVLADENYIRESILDPNAKVRAGQAAGMASFQGLLGEDDINALILYMKTLSDKWTPPEDTTGEGGEGEAENPAEGGEEAAPAETEGNTAAAADRQAEDTAAAG